MFAGLLCAATPALLTAFRCVRAQGLRWGISGTDGCAAAQIFRSTSGVGIRGTLPPELGFHRNTPICSPDH